LFRHRTFLKCWSHYLGREGDVVWIDFDGKIFEQQWGRECGLTEKIFGNCKLDGGEIQEMINCTEGAAA
jgi:hypothetical protein